MARERFEFEKHLNEIDLEKEFGVSFKRHCPFCNNDYICVERNINYIGEPPHG